MILAILAASAICRAQQEGRPGNLVVRSRWVRFDIVAGRITARWACFNQSKTATFNDPETGVHESYSVSASQGAPSVSYERTDRDQHLTIDLIDGNQLDLRQEPRGEAAQAAVHLNQMANSKLALTVATSSSAQRYTANSFWHLMLARPDVCKRHLVPILELLRPDWGLVRAAERVEQALFQYARSDDVLPRRAIARLVEQLGSDDFQERQAADRQLRRMGPRVWAYLNRLDSTLLSPEQRLRIRQILDSFTLPTGDRPERVAAQLLGDPSIWLILLTRPDADCRQAALAHLQRICDRPLDFNPLAAAPERSAQIERLRARLNLH